MALKMFIHGLESSNQGTKSLYFKERYPDMIIPNFRGSLPERMAKLEECLAGQSGFTFVGSSFGGLMATLFALENESRVDKLILLAPALNLLAFAPHEEKRISVPVRVFHGDQDEVIPVKEVEGAARKHFRHYHFHRVHDDHSLHKTFKTMDWDELLS